jgi:hypothetical protein
MQLVLDYGDGRCKIPAIDVVDENGKRQKWDQPSRRLISFCRPPDCRYHLVSSETSRSEGFRVAAKQTDFKNSN